jgi:uncharacterized membrane protein YraQ (UPF0718 family)
MIGAAIFIWLAAGLLTAMVWRREGRAGVAAAGEDALGMARMLALRLPFALLAASFLVQIVPVEILARLTGPQSGLAGILFASVLGGLLPGGPMTSFPIALVFLQGGTGLPQLVALITGWSVFALHRLLAYEAPIMGWRFAALRTVACGGLPVMAGLAAELLARLAGAG